LWVVLRGISPEGPQKGPFGLAAQGDPQRVFLRGVSPEGPQKRPFGLSASGRQKRKGLRATEKRDPSLTLRASAQGDRGGEALRSPFGLTPSGLRLRAT